eukprot:205614-Prymnesium_polylepis.1
MAERPFAYNRSPRNHMGPRSSTSFRSGARTQSLVLTPLWANGNGASRASAEPNQCAGWSRDHPASHLPTGEAVPAAWLLSR